MQDAIQLLLAQSIQNNGIWPSGRNFGCVSHNPAFYEIDQVLGDIGNVIRDPFEKAGDVHDLQ